MPVELKITIKGENSTLKTGPDAPVYESFTFHESDPVLAQYIREAVEEYKGEPKSIKVRALLVVK